MIHVARGGRRPAILGGHDTAAARERRAAAAFYRETSERHGQERFPFAVYRHPSVVDLLQRVFRGKCAYCESLLDAPGGDDAVVDHFRPKRGALDLTGESSTRHYWWLASDWENLYLACVGCVRHKGNFFPVRRSRARPGTRGANLDGEDPDLLDPCRDRPERHLVYGEQGVVASRTRRGLATIEVLALNRKTLVRQRRREFDRLKSTFDHAMLALDRTAQLGMQPDVDESRVTLLSDLAAREQSFACMRRQFLFLWLTERGYRKTAAGRQILERLGMATSYGTMSRRANLRTAATFRRHSERMRHYSVDDSAHLKRYYLAGTNRWVERVVIHNFKAIEHLDFAFPAASADVEPWMMLLGENSTGKSSVLQAVALALAGEKHANGIGRDARAFVRSRCAGGYVKVFLSGEPEPEVVTLEFRRTSKRFKNTPPEPRTLLAAYGSTRLLAGREEAASPPARQVHIKSLFDPRVPLGDSQEWLSSIDSPAFDRIALALKDLLMLGPGDRLERDGRGRVTLVQSRTRVTLSDLSDGYKSMVALALDIMRFLSTRWQSMEDAVGLVLIDELGPHLHPRWKMRIVSQLRRAFPRARFLATTHDPLCLRGLRDGEVAVMQLDEAERITLNSDLPSLQGLRVEQILTSEHFGLESTSDPYVDALLREYYQLLAEPRLKPSQSRRRAKLEVELKGLQVLGTTPREQLVFEAIDTYLARARRTGNVGNRLKLRAETKNRVMALWRKHRDLDPLEHSDA